MNRVADIDVFVPEKSLGIPRSSMPQIKSTLVPDFIDWLKDSGVSVKRKMVDAVALHPTQKEVNLGKVRKLANPKNMTHLRKPVIMSKDGYLLDGHHRWMALVTLDEDAKIPAVVVGLKIRDLLNRAHQFEGVRYKEMEAMQNDKIVRELIAVAKELMAVKVKGVNLRSRKLDEILKQRVPYEVDVYEGMTLRGREKLTPALVKKLRKEQQETGSPFALQFVKPANLDHWVEKHGVSFAETATGEKYGLVFAPHLGGPDRPWVVYNYEGRLSGEWDSYKTESEGERALAKINSLRG